MYKTIYPTLGSDSFHVIQKFYNGHGHFRLHASWQTYMLFRHFLLTNNVTLRKVFSALYTHTDIQDSSVQKTALQYN